MCMTSKENVQHCVMIMNRMKKKPISNQSKKINHTTMQQTSSTVPTSSQLNTSS